MLLAGLRVEVGVQGGAQPSFVMDHPIAFCLRIKIFAKADLQCLHRVARGIIAVH